MPATTILAARSLAVVDYRCDARPGDRPFAEYHDSFAIAYVRKGCFGYRTHAGAFELVTGSLLIGHPGDEYVCTHEHVHGDECLSFHLTAETSDTIDAAVDKFHRAMSASTSTSSPTWTSKCSARSSRAAGST